MFLKKKYTFRSFEVLERSEGVIGTLFSFYIRDNFNW